MDLTPLVRRIDQLVTDDPDRRRLIGIVGCPGSGKTTLAEQLVRALAHADDWRGSRAAHVPMDGFHLSNAELDRLGRRGRKGAPDTFDALGYAATLARIRAGETVYAPTFDRGLDQPVAQSLPVTRASRVVVCEGNYLLLADDPWPNVRACFDEVWYLDLDETVRRERLRARHIRYGRTAEQAEQWMTAVDDPNAARVRACLGRADLVLTEG